MPRRKGFDLIAEIANDLARLPLIIAVLGSGDKEYQDLLLKLHRQYPEKFAVKVAYDNALAHKIEAGADMFLMPSRYEPCGLNQMYSLRYGTVPIVRATGGLDDTIEPWDPATGKGTGFKFSAYSGVALLHCIHEALRSFQRPAGLAQDDAQRHEKGFFLDRFGARVCEDLRATGAAQSRPIGEGTGVQQSLALAMLAQSRHRAIAAPAPYVKVIKTELARKIAMTASLVVHAGIVHQRMVRAISGR